MITYWVPKQKNPLTRGPSIWAMQTTMPVLRERYFKAGTPPMLHEATNVKPPLSAILFPSTSQQLLIIRHSEKIEIIFWACQ